MFESIRRRRFEALALPHLDAAYTLARWLTRNHHDAEDVVQEAYLRAFRYFDGFAGDNPRAWLLTVVRNTCHTWLRRNRPKDVMAMDEPDIDRAAADPATAWADDGAAGDPEQALLRRADRDRLNRLIEDLPCAFREVVILRDIEDLSYKEIAGILAVPIGTVMSRLARARQALRRNWDPRAKAEGGHAV